MSSFLDGFGIAVVVFFWGGAVSHILRQPYMFTSNISPKGQSIRNNWPLVMLETTGEQNGCVVFFFSFLWHPCHLI